MGKRLVRWLTYGIAFALIPLVASLFIHYFLGKLEFNEFSRSPEMLFFSLMVNATALSDMSEFVRTRKREMTLFIIRSGLFIGVIISAILYGAFLFATVSKAIDDDFAARVFWVSLGLALLSFCLATTGQLFLARIGK